MRPVLLSLFSPLVKLLPETRFFALKRWIFRLCGADIADGVRICSSVTFLGPGQLKIGPNTWIGHQTMIVTGSMVEIGAEVDIAPRVFIGTGTHKRGSGTKAAGPGIQKPICIGDGCWIGAGSLLLPGVRLAPVTTVGAGATVTRGIQEQGMTIVGHRARPLTTGEVPDA